MLPGWSTLSRAERDAAYNNNAAVADSAALIERRNAQSAVFRGAVRTAPGINAVALISVAEALGMRLVGKVEPVVSEVDPEIHQAI